MPETPDRTDLVACVRAATLAPSIHNSQPWRFRIRPDGVDVYADWRRRLEVIDADGRQLLISVGAAVFNLLISIYGCGVAATVRLRPAAGEPQLAAAVDLGGPAPSDPALAALVRAIPRRHTNRLPFLPDPVATGLIDELAAAATAEGATLWAVPEHARAAVDRLVRAGDAKLRRAGLYRAELAEWAPAHADRVMPRYSVGWPAAEILPMRDFGLQTPHRRAHVAPADTHPAILVLATPSDSTEDVLRAGQALERAWLTATARGLAVAPMSQPLEVPALRQLMVDPNGSGWPQVILLLGYAPPTTPTPRRDVDEVLVSD
jgi:nitroreductase